MGNMCNGESRRVGGSQFLHVFFQQKCHNIVLFEGPSLRVLLGRDLPGEAEDSGEKTRFPGGWA